MQLVLLNPHANYCGKMVFNWLFRLPHHQKYVYLWREAMVDKKKKISFLVDGKQSSFYQTSYFSKSIARIPLLLKLFIFFEFWIWILLNRINPLRCRIHFNLKRLNPKRDIIFSIGFTSYESRLQTYDGIALVHLSHYQHDTEKIARFFKSLKHGFLVAENNLADNAYFKRYFHSARGIKSVYHLPLTFDSGRFKKTMNFDKRTNKCFASGAMSVPSGSAYIAHYGENSALNPMRQLIYDHQKDLNDVIEAYIYPHHDSLKELKEIKPSDGFFAKWAKKHLPIGIRKVLFNYELPYFRFDIVEKYNQFTMFMSPEEQTGLPSMKMFEGMMCGAAFVGIDDQMYTNIGLVDGASFIAYRENNLEDLKKKITYYQQHPRSLEKIAEEGRRLAMGKFSSHNVLELFWHDLEQLSQSFERGRPHFYCSFVKTP